jgi:transcriptional regulator with XRE-family HTH domain
MKERFKEACKLLGLATSDVANMLGMKPDTFRKALNRSSLNDGYLILIEQATGISKNFLKNGTKPIVIEKQDILLQKIEEDSISVLDSIEKEKIVAYLVLKEKDFLNIHSFNAFVEKLKASKRLRNIANKED